MIDCSRQGHFSYCSKNRVFLGGGIYDGNLKKVPFYDGGSAFRVEFNVF